MKVHNIEIAKINLAKIKNVDCFLQIVNRQEGVYALRHDTFVVNAKSLLGIFSLDLENDLLVIAVEAENSEVNELIEALKKASLLID